ncbi:MAG: porin family protein [Acidobacteria bacterium]|nr:porin family protein [Acidobacteriota bacterium]
MKRDLIRSFVSAMFFTAPALLLTVAPAAAQSLVQPRTWTVTPFIHTSIGIGDPAPDDSIGLGAAVAWDWTPNLGFEGEFSHLFDVAGSTANEDWSITNFSANVVYHFDVRHVTPYATFGMGVERSNYSLKNLDPLALSLIFDPSSTEVAINFGGGVKYPLRDRFIARADLRRFQANDLAPDFWRLYGGVTFILTR